MFRHFEESTLLGNHNESGNQETVRKHSPLLVPTYLYIFIFPLPVSMPKASPLEKTVS